MLFSSTLKIGDLSMGRYATRHDGRIRVMEDN